MTLLKISGHYKKLFLIALILNAFYAVLLVFVLTSIYSLAVPMSNGTSLPLFKIALSAINIFTFQKQAIVYMMILFSFYFRLKLLNHLLRECQNGHSTLQDIITNLKGVRYLIDMICDNMESTKTCFTVTAVICILHFSFLTILLVYGIITFWFSDESSPTEIIHILHSVIWEIFYAPMVIWVLVTGNLIKHEGAKIEVNIQTILYKNQHDEKSFKLAELISMQLQHRRPTIECGIFVIDWKLLFFLLSLCFSYLVIIIQFEVKNF